MNRDKRSRLIRYLYDSLAPNATSEDDDVDSPEPSSGSTTTRSLTPQADRLEPDPSGATSPLDSPEAMLEARKKSPVHVPKSILKARKKQPVHQPMPIPDPRKKSPVPQPHIPKLLPKTRKQRQVKEISNDDEQEETYMNRPEVRIPCPDHLKAILVDDWENVTKNLALCSLPSKIPANKVIDDWCEYEATKRREGSADMEILEELQGGLKEYFGTALGRILLYRFERPQYSKIMALWDKAPPGSEWEGKGAGDVYGAEHLARMVGTYTR